VLVPLDHEGVAKEPVVAAVVADEEEVADALAGIPWTTWMLSLPSANLVIFQQSRFENSAGGAQVAEGAWDDGLGGDGARCVEGEAVRVVTDIRVIGTTTSVIVGGARVEYAVATSVMRNSV